MNWHKGLDRSSSLNVTPVGQPGRFRMDWNSAAGTGAIAGTRSKYGEGKNNDQSADLLVTASDRRKAQESHDAARTRPRKAGLY